MTTKTTDAMQVLDREFLGLRCRIIDIAAAMDRIDRTSDPHGVREDPREAQLHQAIAVLIDGASARAERVQLVFSDDYDPNWRA